MEQYKYLPTQFISLLEESKKECWFQHAGVMAHTVNITAFLKSSLVSTLLGVAFDLCNHQTLMTKMKIMLMG
jgi:hypothetical protein